MENLPNELILTIIKKIKSKNKIIPYSNYIVLLSLLSKRYRILINSCYLSGSIKLNGKNYKIFLYNKYGLKHILFSINLIGCKNYDLKTLQNVYNLRLTK